MHAKNATLARMVDMVKQALVDSNPNSPASAAYAYNASQQSAFEVPAAGLVTHTL